MRVFVRWKLARDCLVLSTDTERITVNTGSYEYAYSAHETKSLPWIDSCKRYVNEYSKDPL